jgi:RNA polymerase sigma factor (TIGR02999 family)
LSGERNGHTLSTTALVHEVYLRLLDQRSVSREDRAQFFAQASRAMRRILIDYARRHRALRRGGAASRLSLSHFDATTSGLCAAPQLAVTGRAEELLALDDALVQLARADQRAARVVECRFFAGLNENETAEALGVTARTVARDWVKARAWLYRALKEGHDDARH